MSDLQPEIRCEEHGRGGTRVCLEIGKAAAGELWIIPYTIRIGEARVRMDGIGGVSTEEAYRNRGYARRMLTTAIERMQSGDAALSMLYGIPDFYPKFGYATAGPDHQTVLTELSGDEPMPTGWRVLPFSPKYLDAVRSLYESSIKGAVGAAERPSGEAPWTRLTAVSESGDPADCRVIVDPAGVIRAYAWRGKGLWYVDEAGRSLPNAMAIAEVIADSPVSADVALLACRRWAREVAQEEKRVVERLVLGLIPEGDVAAAAMRCDADLVQRYVPCGQSMARVLDVGRLLKALRPELEQRLRAAGWPFRGAIRIVTEIGDAVLRTEDGALSVELSAGSAISGAGASGAEELIFKTPQAELARLALGGYPADDVLSRLPAPPTDEVGRLIQVLFPRRHPHMQLLDRF